MHRCGLRPGTGGLSFVREADRRTVPVSALYLQFPILIIDTYAAALDRHGAMKRLKIFRARRNIITLVSRFQWTYPQEIATQEINRAGGPGMTQALAKGISIHGILGGAFHRWIILFPKGGRALRQHGFRHQYLQIRDRAGAAVHGEFRFQKTDR